MKKSLICLMLATVLHTQLARAEVVVYGGSRPPIVLTLSSYIDSVKGDEQLRAFNHDMEQLLIILNQETFTPDTTRTWRTFNPAKYQSQGFQFMKENQEILAQHIAENQANKHTKGYIPWDNAAHIAMIMNARTWSLEQDKSVVQINQIIENKSLKSYLLDLIQS